MWTFAIEHTWLHHNGLYLGPLQVEGLSVVTEEHDVLFQVSQTPVFVVSHSILRTQKQPCQSVLSTFMRGPVKHPLSYQGTARQFETCTLLKYCRFSPGGTIEIPQARVHLCIRSSKWRCMCIHRHLLDPWFGGGRAAILFLSGAHDGFKYNKTEGAIQALRVWSTADTSSQMYPSPSCHLSFHSHDNQETSRTCEVHNVVHIYYNNI